MTSQQKYHQRKNRYDIIINYSFLNTETPTRCVGSNTMYNRRKGNTYVLLDYRSIQQREISVVTNNQRIAYFYRPPYKGKISRNSPSRQYLISRYLTSFFIASVIPKKYSDKYFYRIRNLLVDQLHATMERLANTAKNNRQTNTYIKFSYKHTTFYLGFYFPCNYCSTPVANVLSSNRKSCWKCRTRDIDTPIPPPVFSVNQTKVDTRTITSKRLGWTYEKGFSIMCNNSSRGPVHQVTYKNLRPTINTKEYVNMKQKKIVDRMRRKLKDRKIMELKNERFVSCRSIHQYEKAYYSVNEIIHNIFEELLPLSCANIERIFRNEWRDASLEDIKSSFYSEIASLKETRRENRFVNQKVIPSKRTPSKNFELYWDDDRKNAEIDRIGVGYKAVVDKVYDRVIKYREILANLP